MPAYEDVSALRGDLNDVKGRIRTTINELMAEINDDLTTLKETYVRQNRIVEISTDRILDSVWHSPARAAARNLYNNLLLRQAGATNNQIGQISVVRNSIRSINDDMDF